MSEIDLHMNDDLYPLIDRLIDDPNNPPDPNVLIGALRELVSTRVRVKELEKKLGNKISRSMEEFAKAYFPNSILEYRLVNKDDEPTKGDEP